MWVTGPARPISRARDAAVVRRGGLTVWFTEEAVVAWHATATGERGGQPVYSALAIETGLALRLVFHQPLRQTEGLLRSIVAALKFDIAVPDHTTLSRRGGGMMTLPKLARRDGAGSGGARRQGGRRNARWLETVPTVRCSTGCPGRGGSCGGSGRAPVGRGSTRCPERCGSCGGSGAAPPADVPPDARSAADAAAEAEQPLPDHVQPDARRDAEAAAEVEGHRQPPAD